jgi:hypothetical protein
VWQRWSRTKGSHVSVGHKLSQLVNAAVTLLIGMENISQRIMLPFDRLCPA